VKVRARLHVNGEIVGPGLGEVLDVVLRILDHEVHVEPGVVLVGHGPKGPNHVRADGNVGDKVAVHDIDVEPLDASPKRLIGAVGKSTGIGRDNGRSQNGHRRGHRHG